MRLGFAGNGYIAKIHATAAQAVGAEVAAVSNHRAESRSAFAERFGVGAQFDSVPELLAAGGIDGLVVCTPNALHAPEAIAAMEAGVPVMVEKPMAINGAEAEAMHAASLRTGVPLMIAHCWRFDDEARWLRQQIVDGRLGRIVRTKGYGVHVNWGPKGWFNQAALAGGGALADMGIHALDTVRFLLGDPLPASVYAAVGTHYREMDVDDTATIIVTWQDGTTSYLESGWFQPQADGPEAATQLYGTAGYDRLFPTELRPVEGDPVDPGFTFPRVPHCLPGMYETQVRAFLEVIGTGEVVEGTSAVSLVNARIVDATYESARTGEVVRL